MAITKKRFEEIVKELRRKGEVVPATYDCIYKAIMRNCPKYRADTTSKLTSVSKKLILNTYKEMNVEYIIDNVLEKVKYQMYYLKRKVMYLTLNLIIENGTV